MKETILELLNKYGWDLYIEFCKLQEKELIIFTSDSGCRSILSLYDKDYEKFLKLKAFL
jgi:uroporphyrinogen-III synthase